MNFEIRIASPADRETIQQLIAISARELSRGYYSEEQVSAALKSVYGVDSMLIEDGTYFVAEADDIIIGCGGWSKRKHFSAATSFPNATRACSIRVLNPQRFAHSLFTRTLRAKELGVQFSNAANWTLPAMDSFRWN